MSDSTMRPSVSSTVNVVAARVRSWLKRERYPITFAPSSTNGGDCTNPTKVEEISVFSSACQVLKARVTAA